MNLQEWRSKLREQVTLPSGLEVTIQKVDLLTLAMEGAIPATLMATAQQAQNKEGVWDFSELPELKQVLDAYAVATIIDPPVVAGPGDDTHVSVTEIPGLDKLWLFERANAGVSALSGFREAEGQPDPA